MKKHSAIVVLLLALLMQVRVAYACEANGFWPSEDCDAHGLIVDAHPDAPSDRGDRCDVSLEVAARSGRTCSDLLSLLAEPVGGEFIALLPAAFAVAEQTVSIERVAPACPQASAASAGTRTYLVTARLRL
ncbi:hypothetical protein [Nevskia sp.]|uniref:hypothetical protein n=1 Tax=Nevskia sp. TaxID=1929292 RepID=UPI0025CD608D|nr:hypothetical protein [Nevskia sp.]